MTTAHQGAGPTHLPSMRALLTVCLAEAIHGIGVLHSLTALAETRHLRASLLLRSVTLTKSAERLLERLSTRAQGPELVPTEGGDYELLPGLRRASDSARRRALRLERCCAAALREGDLPTAWWTCEVSRIEELDAARELARLADELETEGTR